MSFGLSGLPLWLITVLRFAQTTRKLCSWFPPKMERFYNCQVHLNKRMNIWWGQLVISSSHEFRTLSDSSFVLKQWAKNYHNYGGLLLAFVCFLYESPAWRCNRWPQLISLLMTMNFMIEHLFSSHKMEGLIVNLLHSTHDKVLN